ncbi:EGFR-like transmembrane domain-containing protein [Sporobolomyces salmoneus]|uniref:EGFR-like transmembrane domain-containing protein n=1 Tax=Sporobolomyces salmoneus TaxID=183962 RepID=UPI00317DA9F6
MLIHSIAALYLLQTLSHSASAQTTTSAPLSLSTTLSQSVVSSATASTTSTSIGPAPTANSTVGESQDLFLWPPQGGLRQCERVTFAFTKPAVPLTCGMYVTNTSTYIEQVILAPTYNTLVSGTFSWLVDMPVGLSVNVQVFVTLNGQIQQYTLPSMTVIEGSDNSCFGRNIGQNTQSIISHASSLNGSYVYTAPSASSTGKPSSGGGNKINGGAIAGIVIGALAGLVLLIVLFFYLRRRQHQRTHPEQSTFGNPPHPDSQFHQNIPPASQAQNYAYSVMSGGSGAGQYPYKRSHPPGTIAEPMSTTPPPQGVAPGSPRQSEMGMRGEGTRGLADPDSFMSRSNSGKAL